MTAETAADCPNCYTDNDDETSCPHLLAGDGCPNCGTELEKPPASKVQCPNCEWIINGSHNEQELRDFELTYRQASRVLQLFGYDKPPTPGSAGTALRELCHDYHVDREEFNDVLRDLRTNPPEAKG